MAGKRHLEDLDSVAYNKLPRLETEPNCVLPTGLCKSSPLPSHGSENHFSYKGTYFAYPLQSPDGIESLTHWSPAASYMQYPGNAASQHMRTDGVLMNCLLYGREAEMQKPGLLNKTVAQAPTGYATLAVPKPVYRSPVCYVDPRASMSLQTQMESMQKRPSEVEWTVPTPVPSGYYVHAKDQSCGTALPKRAHHPDPSFLQLHQGTGIPTKEMVAASVGFPPYHAAFENYRVHQSTSFLEANYPAMYNNQKRVKDVHGSSLSRHTWSKLQPAAASPLARSQTAAYRDSSPACYSVSHYPLTSHKQTFLYQEAPHAEEQNGTLSTLPTAGGYKGTNFPGSGEPRPFSSTYLRHHSPRSYYASPLESYVYSPAGLIPVASPALKPGVSSSEPELQQNSSCKVDYLQQNPSFVFAPSDMALYNASLANTDAGHDGHVDSRVATSHGTQSMRENPRSKEVANQHGAFQLIGALDRLPNSSKRLTEALPKGEPAQLGAPIVITDSPVKGRLVSSPQIISSEEGPKSLRDAGSPPSSPPMPVINNVFSLAPYRNYIEGSKGSAEIPFSKDHQEEESPFRNSLANDVVLDLSLKKELVKANDPLSPAGQTEVTPKGECGEEEAKEGPLKKQRVFESSKTQALPLSVENSSGDKSNFQSSTAFMFKKYKISKSIPMRAVPPIQAKSPPAGPPAAPQANIQPLHMTCLYLKLPDISKSLSPSAPEASPALGEANVSLPSNCEPPAQQTSSSQYFTALHVSLCNRISYFVSGTSPELLKQWLRRKASKGKEIWLGFQDISMLLSKLLSQLETFMFTRKCPFPHVVRAGAIFIPIHVVKEKLFPKLSGASVDHVLQEHKVELRPTTLSEEKLLRDLELKCCTSRMLKLLALKQLPDIYPDLLNLHWHDCVKHYLDGWVWNGCGLNSHPTI
uniref:Chromosome 15 open reading frame 39 n=1 Tax=Chelonoidis abingdonii TaxID=106734 RepID=A0A8C0IZB3_CHEAB